MDLALTTHAWNGRWPTDEYPPDGARIRYVRQRDGAILTSTITSCWCGEEPCFELVNGDRVFVTLDRWAVVAEPEEG